MQTLNLTGHAGGQLGPSDGCYLRPHNDGGMKTLDAQVYPNTQIEAGDQLFYTTTRDNKPVIQTVAVVVERRKCKGDWTRSNVHMDWVRLILQ